MKVKEFWNRFKELIVVLAGIATIATFVIVYLVSESKSKTRESPAAETGNNVPECQRKGIDAAEKEFDKKYPF